MRVEVGVMSTFRVRSRVGCGIRTWVRAWPRVRARIRAGAERMMNSFRVSVGVGVAFSGFGLKLSFMLGLEFLEIH